MAINLRCKECKSDMKLKVEEKKGKPRKCQKCGALIPKKGRMYKVIVRQNGRRVTRIVTNLELAREIDKLCLAAASGAPDENLVADQMRDLGEVWVFALTDALSARRLDRANPSKAPRLPPAREEDREEARGARQVIARGRVAGEKAELPFDRGHDQAEEQESSQAAACEQAELPHAVLQKGALFLADRGAPPRLDHGP